MAIGKKDFFIGHVIWTALAATTKRFPGALIRIRQASSRSIHEVEVLSKDGTKSCKLCFIAKHSSTKDSHWPFSLNAKENEELDNAEQNGFEPFMLLAAGKTGVVCADKELYYKIRNQRKSFAFRVSKRGGEHSYRVSLPNKRPATVSQKSFPGKIIDHIQGTLG